MYILSLQHSYHIYILYKIAQVFEPNYNLSKYNAIILRLSLYFLRSHPQPAYQPLNNWLIGGSSSIPVLYDGVNVVVSGELGVQQATGNVMAVDAFFSGQGILLR